MAVPSSILLDADGVRRLQQLGLSSEVLRESARIGHGHAAGCTDHDPRSLPGTLAWGKGTGHLRDELKPDGWTPDRQENFETVVHPSNSHAVALAAGTSQTGRREGPPPRTKTPRGPATSRAVDANKQLSFAGSDPAFGPAHADGDERETWLLLHYHDQPAGEVRLELSCPDEMTGKQVTGWSERIILESVPLSTELDLAPDVDEDLEIDVNVTRRED
jgi:hypothetical protein